MRQFADIRILEHVVLGHGPLWLDHYAVALAPLCQRLTICYPDLPLYASLNEASKAWSAINGTAIRLEPIPWKRHDPLSDTATLQLACAPGADLTVLTFLDRLMRHPVRVRQPLPAKRPAIWGVWFNPPSPDFKPPSFFRRLFSATARKRQRAQRGLQSSPDWLDGAYLLDQALADRVAISSTQILPDPWPTCPRRSRDEARKALGLSIDSELFLHFGVAHRRKGLDDAVEAWAQVPQKAVLLRAGLIGNAPLPGLKDLERDGRAVIHDRLIAHEEVDLYMRATDWVLLPYRGHEGSSTILSAAAAAQRPVIAADYGVIGRRVRNGKLGLLHEHRSVQALAEAVTRASDAPIASYAAALDAYTEEHNLLAFYESMRATWLDQKKIEERGE